MRVFRLGLGVAVALAAGVGVGAGCAAASTAANSGAGASVSGGCEKDTDCKGNRICVGGTCVAPGAGGAGVGGAGAGTQATSTGNTTSSGNATSSASTASGVTILDAGFDGFGACSSFHAAGTQDPAAMLVVLQGSASMGTNGKWPAAASAIQQAIDNDIFDTMSLGLTSFPKGTTAAPACLEGIFPSVYCSYYTGGTSDPLPVPIAAAGMLKSTASSGVRHDIVEWLMAHGPAVQDQSDSSPVYDAMNAGYAVLQATNIAKRMMVLITDGGFDCTSVSNPTRPGISDGLCPDWEIPTTVNSMITAARTNATAPVDTFVVGVPGSNTTAADPDAAPYDMLLALSTYAVSGSPSTVPAGCDSSAVWSQNGTLNGTPCHIDLSSSNFNANTLATAIATIRDKELGCTYNLPPPPVGMTIDPADVNVVETINGTEYLIPRRKSPSETCLTNPCWDYDMSGKVDLIGIGCTAVQQNASSTVDIYVGCATILQ